MKSKPWIPGMILFLALSLLPPAPAAHAATYTVLTTADSGTGSLRWAINQANANPGPDTIEFNIEACGGVCTIQPQTPLPVIIDDDTTIDGYSQPGSDWASGGTPAVILIDLDGSLAGTYASGLALISDNNRVQGLAINRFAMNGILLGGYTGISATNNIIVGNHIGTDVLGMTAQPNGLSGVFIGLGADQNVVGGTSAAERNVLSGNGWEGVGIHGSGTRLNFCFGNYIGTDAHGTAALPNAYYGVRIYGGAADNLVGGYSGEVDNLISGNALDGVRIAGEGTDDNIVARNVIGLAADGLSALGNGGSGVYITLGAQGNVVGGSATTGANLISGNLEDGVTITGTGTMSNSVAGNLIGTDRWGTGALGNGGAGVEIVGGAALNTVGGDSPAERNLISGNDGCAVALFDAGTMSNTISGNYIGVDVTGAAALANDSGFIVSGATGNRIGGTEPGEGNVISGNEYAGILLIDRGTAGNLIAGNHIGTDAGGTAAIGNGLDGIAVFQEAGGNTIGPGNVVSGNSGSGIVLGLWVTGTVVAGNLIGTDATGLAALGNTEHGIHLDWAEDNTIGGDSPAERNVISANGGSGVYLEDAETAGNVISGNYIGVDANGTAGLGNGGAGVYVEHATGTRIGGAAAGEGNLISGNDGPGVEVWGGSGNTIVGNHIGTDAAGSAALGNGDGVVLDSGAQNNVVGGSAAGEGNLISGNERNGVILYASSGTILAGNLIGTDISGTAALGNATYGVSIGGGAAGNILGGTTAGARNVISGNGLEGIVLESTSSNTIVGNCIGTDRAATMALGNGRYGLYIGTDAQLNSIGGSSPDYGNVIGGNLDAGIYMVNASATGNVISWNWIGVSPDGATALGNGGSGVELSGSVAGNTLGPDNTIAHNAGSGVLVSWATAVNNDITQNSIYANAHLGIDLVAGAHGGILSPTISAVTIVPGTVTIAGSACAGCTVEVFQSSDADGEGEEYIGSATANGGGDFTLVVASLGRPYLTATATGAAEGTSEFSAAYTATVSYRVYLPVVYK